MTMTVDDALRLAEDVENHGEKRSNSLSGQALVALAGEVRRLQRKLDAAEAAARADGRYIIPDGYAE